MPFPLAHPAAVLPLRRWCPRYLSFPALLVGSVTPDLSYAFQPWNLEGFAHQYVGCVGFSLPMGLALMIVFAALRRALPPHLPERWQRVTTPWCEPPLGNWMTIACSVLLGACLHVTWDAFTHREGWLVQHWELLEAPLYRRGSRTLRVCHVLWYASTFVGVTSLLVAGRHGLQRAMQAAGLVPPRLHWWQVLFLAFLVLPLGAVHHVFHGRIGYPLTALLLVVGMGVFLWWHRPR